MAQQQKSAAEVTLSVPFSTKEKHLSNNNTNTYRRRSRPSLIARELSKTA